MKAAKRFQAIWQQNRSWPVILVALMLASVTLFFINQSFVAPKVNVLERDYLGLQERSRQARKARAASDNPNAFYQRGVDDLEKFRALIPNPDGLTDLVAELFRLAGKANLKISQVNYQPKELKAQGLLEYSLVFSVGGSYQNLKTFIAHIEASKRLIAIEGIALRRDQRAGDRANLRLELATYFKAGAT